MDGKVTPVKLRVRLRLDATEPCVACNGTGKRPVAKETGRMLREWRESLSIPMRRVAQHLGYTVSYLSDLELGHRQWSPDLIDRYIEAVESTNGRGTVRVAKEGK